MDRVEDFFCALTEFLRGRAQFSAAAQDSDRDPLRFRGETQKFNPIAGRMIERVGGDGYTRAGTDGAEHA